MNYRYLLDSNVLATSKVMNSIESKFFKEHCVIISEVAYELSNVRLADKLSAQAVPPTIGTLQNLKKIVDDLVKLGILKTDHGNGEAMLLAEALSLNEINDQVPLAFMQEHAVVVTNEKLVEIYAKSIGINAINGKEFSNILSSAANN